MVIIIKLLKRHFNKCIDVICINVRHFHYSIKCSLVDIRDIVHEYNKNVNYSNFGLVLYTCKISQYTWMIPEQSLNIISAWIFCVCLDAGEHKEKTGGEIPQISSG